MIAKPFLALVAALFAHGSLAQQYPTKPVRLIVAAAPGGSTDLLGRLLGQRLGERLGQPFVIDNRGGASGVVAGDGVAKAPDATVARPTAP